MSELSNEHAREFVEREAYARYQEILAGAELILKEGNPARWWHRLYRYFSTQQKKLDGLPAELSESIARQLDEALTVLRAQTGLGSTGVASDYQTAAQNAIHEMADLLHRAPETKESSPTRFASYEDLAFVSSDVKVERRDGQVILSVRPDAESPWGEYAMPKTDRILMKGGLPRIALKRLVGAPRNLVAAEFPVNDIDVIADGEDKVTTKRQAMELGADAEGIEWSHDVSNLSALLWARDVDLNQCFLTNEGLVYTERAAAAAGTGTILALAADRGIYGNEQLVVEGVRLVKNRALSRLVKFAAEGKATGFDMLPLNRQVSMGVYWLVLARKFMFKRNGPELMDRMMEIGRQMGQVRGGESAYDVLDRVHAETPFFNFSEGTMDDAGVTRWLGSKLGKLADRLYRTETRMKLGLKFDRAANDTVPYRISLEGYVSDPARLETIRAEWPDFVRRCEERRQNDAAAVGDNSEEMRAVA